MNPQPRAGWLAWHIFHGGDQDRLLLEAVAPMLRDFKTDGLLRRFFFLRYWNGGTHLRLRLEVPEGKQAAAVVGTRLQSQVGAFLARCPGPVPDSARYAQGLARMRALDARLGGEAPSEVHETLQRVDTVQPRPYCFDAARYGEHNQDATHEHAWRSSQLVLAMLEVTRGAGALRMLALHACAMAACVMGPVNADTAAWFDDASQWDASAGQDADAYWRGRGFMSVSEQHAALASLQPMLAGADLGTARADALLLGAWKAELQRRHAWLQAHAAADPARAMALLFDGLHLFCNRLGMTLDVECYLYYLCAGAVRTFRPMQTCSTMGADHDRTPVLG